MLQALRDRWHPDHMLQLLSNHDQYYGKRQPRRTEAKPGRNEPCPCQSGKKYKHCCGG